MYEWLLDYHKLSDEIDYLEYQLDREKRELKRWSSGDLYNVKLSENSIASGLEERIFKMEYDLAHKMNDQYDAKKLISTFKGLENKILYYKYVEGMSLVEISTELNYSYNYIKSKHAELMRMIKFVDKVTSK